MLRRAHRSGGLARAARVHVPPAPRSVVAPHAPNGARGVRAPHARAHARTHARVGLQSADANGVISADALGHAVRHSGLRMRPTEIAALVRSRRAAIYATCRRGRRRPAVAPPTAGAHDAAALRLQVSLGAAEGSRGAIVEVSARYPNRSAAPVGLRTLSTLDGLPCPNPTITMGFAAPSSCLPPATPRALFTMIASTTRSAPNPKHARRPVSTPSAPRAP